MILNADMKTKSRNLKAGKKKEKKFRHSIHEKKAFAALFFAVFFLSFSVFAKSNSPKKKSSPVAEDTKNVAGENESHETPVQNSLSDSEQDLEFLEIQEEIDFAVEIRSPEYVAQILKNNADQENYPKIENLVLEKVRNLVFLEDFELAKNIALCMIEVNVENFEAIDLYSFIEKTMANERAYKRAQILKRNRELKGAGHEID